MTDNKQLKQAARHLAVAEGISYTDALYRLDPARAEQQTGAPSIFTTGQDSMFPLTWDALNTYLDETESGLEAEDPYRRAASFQHRAFLYNQLAAQTSEPTYKAACYRAAICDEASAARIRFEHGIPNIKPQTEAHLLGLRTCEWCGRPWQVSKDGACEHCPRMKFGPAPSSRAEAENWAIRPTPAATALTITAIEPTTPDPYNRDDPGYCGRPVDDPDGEAAYLEQERRDDLATAQFDQAARYTAYRPARPGSACQQWPDCAHWPNCPSEEDD